MLPFLAKNWPLLVRPALTVLAVLAAGWLVKRALFGRLRGWASRSAATWDDLMVSALEHPFMLWMLMLALYAGNESSDLPRPASAVVSKALLALLILSITLAAARIAGILVARGEARDGAASTSTISQNVARGAVIVLGAVSILNALGVSITPVLGALGIAGLAVSLGLQDTLANFFAGFYISIAKQIRIGDYIRLDGTQLEGFVTDINWRATTIRNVANNLVLIPNGNLAKANVVNFMLPEPRTTTVVPVSLAYGEDLDRAERILLDVAGQTARDLPQILEDPPPLVRFANFGDYAIQCNLIVHVREFTDQFLAQSELRKRIMTRFAAEGVAIPFPTYTIRQESGTAAPATPPPASPAA
jgi:small-conductance mechanosensitive channel